MRKASLVSGVSVSLSIRTGCSLSFSRLVSLAGDDDVNDDHEEIHGEDMMTMMMRV